VEECARRCKADAVPVPSRNTIAAQLRDRGISSLKDGKDITASIMTKRCREHASKVVPQLRQCLFKARDVVVLAIVVIGVILWGIADLLNLLSISKGAYEQLVAGGDKR
jgi:hypothetical protein